MYNDPFSKEQLKAFRSDPTGRITPLDTDFEPDLAFGLGFLAAVAGAICSAAVLGVLVAVWHFSVVV